MTKTHIFLAAAFAAGLGASPALAQSTFREIETKYLFGFTSGSDIGSEGENEVALDTTGRFLFCRADAPSSTDQENLCQRGLGNAGCGPCQG